MHLSVIYLYGYLSHRKAINFKRLQFGSQRVDIATLMFRLSILNDHKLTGYRSDSRSTADLRG